VSAVDWWHGLPVQPEPGDSAALRLHLIEAHAMNPLVVDEHSPEAWVRWHRAEHKTRHPAKGDPTHGGHLTHTHPTWLPKAAAA